MIYEDTDTTERTRHHFRHLGNHSTPAPLQSTQQASRKTADAAQQPAAVDARAVDYLELEQKLNESLHRLPPGSRVRVRYPADDSDWDGTVVKSWLPKDRKARRAMAHHITVYYDDPRYRGELFEHSVLDSSIEVLPPRSNNGTMAADKLGKRLKRLQRELG